MKEAQTESKGESTINRIQKGTEEESNIERTENWALAYLDKHNQASKKVWNKEKIMHKGTSKK